MNFKTVCALSLVCSLAVPVGGAPSQRRGSGVGGRGQRASQPARSQAARGERRTLPAGTSVYRDVTYVTNGHAQQRLDLYVPKSAKNLPLIIFIHGGAFARGDKSQQDPGPFVSDGYAFASINYRLSQHAVFPAQIEDCKAAVRWLRSNAAKYNLDSDRFGVWGTSAGGHLAAMLGTTGDTTTFDVGENLEVSSRVQAVADWYGPTDFLQMDAHRLPDGMSHNPAGSPESRLIGGALQRNREKAAAANPINYITPADTPFLIAHGDADRLVPYHQSVILEAALKRAGVPVTLLTVRGGGHGIRNANADRMRREFFAGYLKRAFQTKPE